MTNPDAKAAGNAEATPIATNNALYATVQTINALIARVAPINPHSVCSNDWPYHPPTHIQLKKHSITPHVLPHGVANAYATTPVMKR